MLRMPVEGRGPVWAGTWSRIAVVVALGWTSTIHPVLAQSQAPAEQAAPPAEQPAALADQPAPAPQAAPEAAPPADAPPAPDAAQRQLPAPPAGATAQGAVTDAKPYTLSELEYLLGPIALYPDTLLALIFPAAAQPLEIIHASRWLDEHPEAVATGDFSEVDQSGWDASIQGLMRFPEVVHMLADHLEWTESLGMAFEAQPEDVAVAIQVLRAQAEKVGNLKTTEQQIVETREDNGRQVIYITPANPERIYVPTYDTSTVFTTAAVGALAFTTGVIVGSSWNNRWGWNNLRWNNVWVYRPGWNRPPGWRPDPGRPGRPPNWRPDRPDRPGRPDRPDRPGRPDRPDRPGRPDGPGAGRPDRPLPPTRPDRPGVRPERPDRPNVRPDRPDGRPDRPSVRPDRPDARPDRPSARPDRPAARPDRPSRPRPETRPSRPRPESRPSRPQTRPRPESRPSRPQARPSQNARPRPQQSRRQPSRERRPVPPRNIGRDRR